MTDLQVNPINLRNVRAWAIEHRVPRAKLLLAYRAGFRLSVARLIQAVYRERLCASDLIEHPLLGTSLVLGDPPELLVPIVPRVFTRINVEAWPPCYQIDMSPLKWSGPFLRKLCRLLGRSPASPHLGRLSEDFQNSLSNLVLNRLLGGRRGVASRAPEPAYQGHHYYPFPGLRVGPSLDQVVACSHLNTRTVALPLVDVASLAFRSTVFADPRDCFVAWAGMPLEGAATTIPVHPWQLEISPVVAEIVSSNGARVLKRKVICRPLASQRTLRVQSTNYDIKLAVDAALTSEHRLLFRLNCENAPTVSALVGCLLKSRAAGRGLDIQPDVASLSFADTRVAAHLSAIVRAPIRVGGRERAIPAINLWTGPEIAGKLLHGAGAKDVNQFFRTYCRILLRAPVEFLLRFGLAFEPHLQNSIIVFRGPKPVGLILRDLDGTVMERKRVRSLLREFNLKLAPDTWAHMPDATIGGSRLIHSLFLGHLGEVIDFLTAKCRAQLDVLLRLLAEEWESLPRVMNLPQADDRFDALSAHLKTGKLMLMARLERSMRMGFVDLPESTRVFKLSAAGVDPFQFRDRLPAADES